MILDVLPADIAPRLDVLPMSFPKRLLRKVPKPFRHWWAALGAAVIIAGAMLLIWRPWLTPPIRLPAGIRSQIIDFRPYFLSSNAKEFSMRRSGISFSGGVLFFEVHDQAGNSIVVSEQALPAAFANTTPQGDQTVSGVQIGKAALSTKSGRITGSIITTKDPKDLISIAASTAAGTSSVQDLMRALQPV